MTLLSIRDLDVFYGKAQALHEVSLEVGAGKIVAIIGPNGAGKSTLLDSVVGLTKRQGQITFDGRDVSRMAPAKIARLEAEGNNRKAKVSGSGGSKLAKKAKPAPGGGGIGKGKATAKVKSKAATKASKGGKRK